jgi:hypothetical protein
MPVFIPRRPRGVAVGGVEGSTTGEVVSYGNSAMNKLKPQDYRRAVPGIARIPTDERSPDRPSSSHDARTGEAGFGMPVVANRQVRWPDRKRGVATIKCAHE